MAFLSQRFDWRDALVIVQPRTLIRWHRQSFRMLWLNKSQAGRPAIPPELERLIRRMANENITWGEERIANELLLKLGISVSPRTVRKYMPRRSNHSGSRGDKRWSTFLKNHASAIVACDFCIVVIANFSVLYAFVLIEHGFRRLIKTPRQRPKANAICKRVIGTLRRECLNHVIPLSESHLQRTMKLWATHYNRSHPHSAIGPDIPFGVAKPSAYAVRLHRDIKLNDRTIATPILGGLHHDYRIMAA